MWKSSLVHFCAPTSSSYCPPLSEVASNEGGYSGFEWRAGLGCIHIEFLKDVTSTNRNHNLYTYQALCWTNGSFREMECKDHFLFIKIRTYQ